MATAIHDAKSNSWTVPTITWAHVREVNAVLRNAGVDLCLPQHSETKEVLWDWHLPSVQQWLLSWPGAPVCLAAVLLDTPKGIDPKEFAGLWVGDAGDRLREAIWQEWVHYLPQAARALAVETERSVRELRANAMSHLEETFRLLVEAGVLKMEQEIAKARKLLAEHGPSGTSGDSPVALA